MPIIAAIAMVDKYRTIAINEEVVGYLHFYGNIVSEEDPKQFKGVLLAIEWVGSLKISKVRDILSEQSKVRKVAILMKNWGGIERYFVQFEYYPREKPIRNTQAFLESQVNWLKKILS